MAQERLCLEEYALGIRPGVARSAWHTMSVWAHGRENAYDDDDDDDGTNSL